MCAFSHTKVFGGAFNHAPTTVVLEPALRTTPSRLLQGIWLRWLVLNYGAIHSSLTALGGIPVSLAAKLSTWSAA